MHKSVKRFGRNGIARPKCETCQRYGNCKYDGPCQQYRYNSEWGDMRPRVYISGPVTGKENRNVVAFEDAARALDAAGYRVSVPTRFTASTTERGKAMKGCITELLRCDGVCMLDGWEMSKGAALEHAVALACGMECGTLGYWIKEVG